MPIDWNTITICATIAACSCGGGFAASRFLSNEFAGLKTDMRDIKDALTTRITDHELADQRQFEAIRNRVAIVETKAEINRHDIHHVS